MRSARLLSTCGHLFWLVSLCFAGTDKSASTIADLPPEAQAGIVTGTPAPPAEYSLTMGVGATGGIEREQLMVRI